MTTPNRREFTRVQVNLITELRMGGSAQIVGTLFNVSLNGLFLHCDARLPLGTPCDASLILDGGLGQMYIQVHGTVTRVESTGMAIQFTEVIGGDSLAHLRNLVLYNSGDQANQVEQEFSEHTGLKNPS